MADNKHGLTTNETTGIWELDAAAFLPEPAGYITVDGQKYPIYSFLDISVEASLRVVKIGESISTATTWQERMEHSIAQIMALNAQGEKKLTTEQLYKLAPTQIILLTLLATSVAKVPLKADASNEESVSSAPVSADSTDGATAISGS